MRSRQAEFADAEIVVVTFTKPRNLKGYRRRFADPLRVVTDRERVLYDALGLKRGSLWRVWGWRAGKKYWELWRAGKKIELPDEDTLQLGGDAIVDRDGKVSWTFRGDGPDDRPSVDKMLEQLPR